MSQPAAVVDPHRLRRLVLKRQALSQREPFGRGPGATRRAVEHLGYVQIDSINVVDRAHHHVLASRNADHCADFVRQQIRNRTLFEYWFHAAALLPIDDYRFALPRMQQSEIKLRRNLSAKDRRLERYLLDRIRAEGPLAAKDFEGQGGGGGWWDWKPAKRGLERLFFCGELMVHDRQGFQKQFDLRERVLPAKLNLTPPDATAEAEHLINHALRTLGYVALAEATYLRRSAPLRAAVKTLLDAAVEAGTLRPLRWPDGRPLWVDAAAYAGRRPLAPGGARILSPFDNLIIQRRRLKDLFNFDYQLECYLPAAQRTYGYFTLPVLVGETLLLRLDAKAHRAEARLEIRALHFERSPTAPELGAIAHALAQFAARHRCPTLRLPRRPQTLTRGAWDELQRAATERLAGAEDSG